MNEKEPQRAATVHCCSCCKENAGVCCTLAVSNLPTCVYTMTRPIAPLSHKLATDDLVLLLVCCLISAGDVYTRTSTASNWNRAPDHRIPGRSTQAESVGPSTGRGRGRGRGGGNSERFGIRSYFTKWGSRWRESDSGAKGMDFVGELAYVKALHFCEDSASAIGFALSTFEVRA